MAELSEQDILKKAAEIEKKNQEAIAESKKINDLKLKRQQDRQRILNDLGPKGGPMRRVVGHVFRFSKKDRVRIKELVEKLEAIQ